MTKRRELLIALTASGLSAQLGVFAQQPAKKVYRIGFLWESEPSGPINVRRLAAFKAGMSALGYTEGRDYAIEHRSAQRDLDLLPALAAELKALKVDVIAVPGTAAAVAAHNATREIPILFAAVGDPIGIGLASSLRHPGGNVTGLTTVASELKTKHLDLLREMVPGMARVGFLYDPDNSSSALGWKQFEATWNKLQLRPIGAPLRKAEEIEAAFNTMRRDKAQAFVVSGGSTNIALRKTIIEHAAKYRLPAVYPWSAFVEAGGLFSYAVSDMDLFRRAADYADKIFKGARPGDLPIEQPVKFETVINLKTAKSLGITIPQSILVRADRVIE